MTPREMFIEAATQCGWLVSDPDQNVTLSDLAEHLFDHAVRGSDPWSLIMTRVRDGVVEAESVGATVNSVKVCLGEATLRATQRLIALPGAQP